MNKHEYQCIKYEEIIEVFEKKDEAINYALSHKCDYVIKYDNFNFQPLGIVWEKL